MWRSPQALWFSLAFIITVIVVGLVVGLTSGSTPPMTVTAPAGLALTDHDQSLPAVAPNVTWSDWQGASLPSGGTVYGPTGHDGPDAVTGFAHTPRGAVLAVANAAYRGFLGSDAGWRKAVVAEIAPGPGRDILIAKRSGCTVCNAPGDGLLQLAGFKMTSYTPDLATVVLAFSSADTGLLQSTVYTAVWKDSDWRLLLQSDMTPGATTAPLTSMDGFVPFLPGLNGTQS
jgi:hypothetical protein